MGLLGLLISEPGMFFVLVIPLMYSIIAHEVAHGTVALLFGDNTAKQAGRLTFNPLKHLDPAGTIALFIVGFGWAKPVPVNYGNLKNFRAGLVCVALAGCAANLLIATVAIALMQKGSFGVNSIALAVCRIVAQINIILCAFNLIPIPPLDGSKVLMGFLPQKAQQHFVLFERYGFYLLIGLLLTGMLRPVISVVQTMVFGVITAILS